jgi:hypothetical protein
LSSKHRLLAWLAAGALGTASSPARAEITISKAEYQAGVTEIRGKTSNPYQTVTLDGRYSTVTERYNRFEIWIRYLPPDCVINVKAGQEVHPVYISNCEI